MPREQRVNLKKTAAVETERGTFKSKPVGTVNMPFVEPKKSSGQALAEGLEVGFKTLARVGEGIAGETSKRRAIAERNKGILAGRTEAYNLITESKQLLKDDKITLEKSVDPKDARLSVGEWFALQIGKSNDTLGQNESMHSAYLQGHLSTLGDKLGSAQAGNETLIADKKLEQSILETNAGIQSQFELGVDGATNYNELRTTSALNMTNVEYGKLYVSTIAGIIKQKHQDDPNYDAQADIDKHLKIITKEGGINFATHKDYGKMIDTLETSIKTLNKARATQADTEEKERINNWTNASVYKLTVGTPTAEDVALINEELQLATEQGIGTEKFSKVANALSTHLDRSGFGKNSNPEILNAFKQQASQGKLNQELLKYNKHKVTRDDFLGLLNTQSKYENDYADETKRKQIEGVNKARIAGKGLVADTNEFGMIMGDQKVKQRAFAFDQQFELYLQSYMEANNNERPPGDVAFAKAQSIAESILKAQDATDVAPNINNYTVIAPFIQANDLVGLKKALAEDKFTKEEAAAVMQHFKTKEK